ncbi:formate/nitrite transporter family protein [Clostridium sartagoforme]|uniref:Formate/nitrite transporter family protein n=1 Tax=Clostridium sartagoforme TaxID=84031 RepID=A0A4S2DMX4_9CLOT|nr:MULTISPECIES: formate/nitrite transporter family protein [Clostridium]MBS5937259.1 formate/nitrite transporter family protein [Clostridium sp.]TGY43686.1 formate/nitrite transporter family protein [Clostridium sartagoforme]
MFNEELNKVSLAAKSKFQLLKENKIGYFISSMLAGIYVGLGIMLIFTIGGLLTSGNSPATKIVMGLSFGVALSLVVFAGSELFTGNNFVMAVGSLNKSVTWGEAGKVWIVSFIGNLVGSILAATLFYMAGLATGPVGEFIAKTSEAKMSVPATELFFRGILCNMLVCLAIWCTFKCKEESSKLIMIFWCLFVFITAGFEHSVANMTLLTIGLLSPLGHAVSISGYAYNILIVSLGNMVGGILFIAVPYFIISRKKKLS